MSVKIRVGQKIPKQIFPQRHGSEEMMTKEEHPIIVNFMTPSGVARVLVVGRGHINHVVKMRFFFKSYKLFL